MPDQIIEYRGYQLTVKPQGTGYKIDIRRPGAAFSRPQIPFSPDKSELPKLIAEAEALVDALLNKPSQ
jgi:hypothetical protein